jgi:hypothetical protein
VVAFNLGVEAGRLFERRDTVAAERVAMEEETAARPAGGGEPVRRLVALVAVVSLKPLGSFLVRVGIAGVTVGVELPSHVAGSVGGRSVSGGGG